MKKTVVIAVLSLVLALALSACGQTRSAGAPAAEQPAAPAEQVAVVPAAEQPAAVSARQDGERFDAQILLEGTEETVHYEHALNTTAGIAIDYEYESLMRRSEGNRERFISLYDDPEAPTNYLEVSYSPLDAEAAAAAVSEALSGDYELAREERVLDGAGRCIHIQTTAARGGGLPTQLQERYIIPASDGSRIAALHYSFEAAEGFGRRFAYMLNSLTVTERSGAALLSDEEALAAVRNYCYRSNPDLEAMVNAGEYPIFWTVETSDAQQIVVLYRSYTGAEVRYYVNRATGDSYVTEFVPGITPEEARTEESPNLWAYVTAPDEAAEEPSLSITGTWQTASVGYEADGTMTPEYYVMFTDRDVVYGHMRDGAFAFDHSDRIVRTERTAAGGFRVQAESGAGQPYTYQSAEADPDVLEYYETWDEAAFPDSYRGGASLSRCD